MTYIALLRGINVGGTGMLPMKDLVHLCEELGFTAVRTYIQSGNVVFDANGTEQAVCAAIEQALHAHMAKPVDVMVRTAVELRAILAANPFPDREPSKVAIAFLAAAPPPEADNVTGPAGEQVRTGLRELFIDYPDGMGRSKLKLPLGKAAATVRNVNTITKLAAMAS